MSWDYHFMSPREFYKLQYTKSFMYGGECYTYGLYDISLYFKICLRICSS